MQQPVDFFCKEIVPGQHRLEAPFRLLASSKPWQAAATETQRCERRQCRRKSGDTPT